MIGEINNEYPFSGLIWAKLVCMVNDIIEELLDVS